LKEDLECPQSVDFATSCGKHGHDFASLFFEDERAGSILKELHEANADTEDEGYDDEDNDNDDGGRDTNEDADEEEVEDSDGTEEEEEEEEDKEDKEEEVIKSSPKADDKKCFQLLGKFLRPFSRNLPSCVWAHDNKTASCTPLVDNEMSLKPTMPVAKIWRAADGSTLDIISLPIAF
jgi:cobalamin biosynthesis protein CobT